MANELIIELENAASNQGLSINELCRRADVARSTITRAKSGVTSLNMSTYNKLLAALKPPPTKQKRKTRSSS